MDAAADRIAAKIKAAVKDKRLPKGRPAALVEAAVEAGVLTADEAEQVAAAEAARRDAIEVDCFTLEEYLQSSVAPAEPTPLVPRSSRSSA